MSWAPFNGGFRSGVSHVLIHKIDVLSDVEEAGKRLRQISGRIGLRGTVVGIATAIFILIPSPVSEMNLLVYPHSRSVHTIAIHLYAGTTLLLQFW